ncbi:MAG: bifunctional metallophosphatase/5'-nucleotidase [Kiritimatiellia bacterium]
MRHTRTIRVPGDDNKAPNGILPGISYCTQRTATEETPPPLSPCWSLLRLFAKAGRVVGPVLLLLLCFPVQADKEITILHTSDIHGHIFNWDYARNTTADLGLATIASLIAQERARDPDLLLLDGGDTIQGSPLAYYFAIKQPAKVNPLALVMNTLGYTAMTIGNHEFNFGPAVLEKFISEIRFPVICANITGTDKKSPYQPYLLKTVKGVKVAILGLITPGVPSWEKPQNITGLSFGDAIETTVRFLPEIKKEAPSIIIALCHSGLHMRPVYPNRKDAWLTDYRTWESSPHPEAQKRDFVIRLAESFPDFTVILSGHTHTMIPKAVINGVLVVQPEPCGRGLCKVTVRVSTDHRIVARESVYLACKGVVPDQRILDLARPFHEATLAFLSEPLTVATGSFPGGHLARRRDGPLADLINAAQLAMAAEADCPAQVALTAIFSEEARIGKGAITMRDIYTIYPYENTLVVLEITGEILRRALEQNALYWQQFDPKSPPKNSRELVAPHARGYDWDVYSGVEYAIDITRPPGKRLAYLRLNGKEVTSDQRIRIALNNYRFAGGGGFTMFKEGKVLWESETSIRDYLADFIAAHKRLDPRTFFTPNWTLLPENLPD